MSKYEPLRRFLADRCESVWSGRFADIERMLASALPDSARSHRAWWANQSGRGHVQAHAWMDEGWRVDRVDLVGQDVTFVRRRDTTARPRPEPSLHDRAAALTGMTDRDALVDLALQVLIRRETAARLSGLGGTMPDAAAPDRRRPE